MSDKEQEEGEGKGEQRQPLAAGGLGILFFAAAAGLVFLLSVVGLLAYFAMTR